MRAAFLNLRKKKIEMNIRLLFQNVRRSVDLRMFKINYFVEKYNISAIKFILQVLFQAYSCRLS